MRILMLFFLFFFFKSCTGKNVVPEQADEAQEAAEEGAGRAQDPRRAGADHGALQRRRPGGEERGGAEARPAAGLLHAGRPRRRGGRRRGHRGRHLLPGSSTIVGGRDCFIICTLAVNNAEFPYLRFKKKKNQLPGLNKEGFICIITNVNIYLSMQSGSIHCNCHVLEPL